MPWCNPCRQPSEEGCRHPFGPSHCPHRRESAGRLTLLHWEDGRVLLVWRGEELRFGTALEAERWLRATSA